MIKISDMKKEHIQIILHALIDYMDGNINIQKSIDDIVKALGEIKSMDILSGEAIPETSYNTCIDRTRCAVNMDSVSNEELENIVVDSRYGIAQASGDISTGSVVTDDSISITQDEFGRLLDGIRRARGTIRRDL